MKFETHRWEVEIRGDVTPRHRLDKALALRLPEEAGISRSRISDLIQAGCVRRGDEEITKPDAKTQAGEVYTIECKLASSDHILAEDIPLNIVHEDSDLIVIDKPVGLVVHPARGNWRGTLVNALLHHCGEEILTIGLSSRPGIVHRLDKDTSGVMVSAKTDRAMLKLSEQFHQRTVARRYNALVRGVPGAKTIGQSAHFHGVEVTYEADGWICINGAIDRHSTNRLRQQVVLSGGRHAITRVRLIETLANGTASLVECKLETGRTHQIRVHLECVGHPIIGDQIYGTDSRLLSELAGEMSRNAAAHFPRQALHAASLEFSHPANGKRMRFESEFPTDMQDLMSALSQSDT